MLTHITGAIVKSIRADLLKSTVTLTFETYLDDQMMDNKRNLALLAVDQARIDLTIMEQQMKLPFMDRLQETKAQQPEPTPDTDTEPLPQAAAAGRARFEQEMAELAAQSAKETPA